jgi:hypothetical protein
MANSDIDINSPHYKGEFGSIYEVNRKFPTGGVAGDFVVIEGWAHYWNADRATWCVNAERDSYWDELVTNILEKFKLFRGATYMGVAGLDTVPEKATGVKMYYFAIVPGTYTNFGDFVVPQGINVLYSENGKSWLCSSLLEVTQEVGESEWKVVSQNLLKKTQDLINAELEKKANAADVASKFTAETARVDAELAKKANAADVASKFNEESSRVNAELAKKANAEEVASKFSEEATRVDAELAKKANAKDVEQSFSEQTAKNTEQDAEIAKKANAADVATKADVAKTNAEQDKEISRKANQQDVERSLNILRKEIGERTVVEGDVNNNPDEEDLTSKMGSSNRAVLSLKSREYNPLEFSGKGYKILRKNIQKVTCAITKIQVTKIPATDGYVSIIINGVETHVDLVASTDNTVTLVAKKIADKLSETMYEYVTSIDGTLVTCTRRFGGDVTTSSFSGVNTGSEATVSESSKTELRNLLTADMISEPNTIYEIRYDFDLDGATIEMQEGCTLKFEGGSFRNGIVKGSNTRIIESKAQLFDSIILRGSFDVPFLYYDNFGVIADAEDNNNSDIINKTNDFIKSTNINTLTFASSLYYINKQIVIELDPREETLNMIGHSVTIKATESFSEDYLLRINYTSFATTTRTIIKGLTLNCNVLTGGINIPNGNCIKIYNVDITNVGVNKKGILISSGGELHFANSRITGNNKGDCFGICFYTSDCTADNIVMIDVKTAIYQSGSSNIYSDIHPWVSSPQNFQGSKFLLIGAGQAHLNRCSCDTYQFAIYSINSPFITFSNSVFFQNTTVVDNASDKNALVIFEEENSTNSHYSFSGCNIAKYPFQRFSNNDNKIKERCNFAGSLLFDKFYDYNGIPEIPFAQYSDITGVYKDGLFKSNDMRKLPQQINPTDGHLYLLFNFSNWQGKQVIIMGIVYSKVFVLAINGYNNTINAHSIYGEPPVSLYTKNSELYLSCPKQENTPYNTALILGVSGVADFGEKEVNETYTKVDFEKKIGTTENRPSNPLYEGYEYYDTTLKKKILWNGTAWVNMDGTELETSNEQGAEKPS